jgi:hypothetical protein
MDVSARKTVPDVEGLIPDNRFWKIVWHQDFSLSQANKPYFNIAVIIAPLKTQEWSVRRFDDEHIEEFRVRWINASYLRVLVIGSIWTQHKQSDGKVKSTCVSFPARGGTVLDLIFESNPRFIHLSEDKEFLFPEQKHSRRGYIPRPYYSIGPGLNSYCLAVPYNGDPAGVLIPCSEILRAEYCESDMLVQGVLGNWLDMEPERLLDEKKSTPYSKTGYTETPLLHLSKHFMPNLRAIKVLANLCFDARARMMVNRAHNSLVSSIRRDGRGSLKIAPMGVGNSKIKAHGKWITIKAPGLKTRKRFVVFSITHWDMKLPLEEVLWDSDIDPRQAEHAEGGLKPSTFPVRNRPGEDLNIDEASLSSEQRPSGRKSHLGILIPGISKPAFENMHVSRKEKEEQTHTNEGCGRYPGSYDSSEGGAGDQSDDINAPAPINMIDDGINASDFIVPKLIKRFCEAMECLSADYKNPKKLRADNTGVMASPIAIGKYFESEEYQFFENPIIVNLFPRRVQGEQKPFCYVDEAHTQLRQYVAFTLFYRGRHILAIEVERKSKDESISTLLVANDDFSVISQHDLNLLLYYMASKTKTGSLIPSHNLRHLVRQPLYHIQNDTSSNLARRIKDYVHGAVIEGRGKLAKKVKHHGREWKSST